MYYLPPPALVLKMDNGLVLSSKRPRTEGRKRKESKENGKKEKTRKKRKRKKKGKERKRRS